MAAGQTPSPPAPADLTRVPLAAVGVLCLAGAEVSVLTSVDVDGALVAPVWLAAAGVAWVAVALPLVLHGQPPVDAVVLALAHAAEGLLAAHLLVWVAPDGVDLSYPAHLFALAGAAVVTPLVSGATAALLLAGRADVSGIVWLLYWFAGTLGLFLGTGVLLGWWRWRRAPAAERGSALECGLALMLSAAAAHGIYGDVLPDVLRAPTYVLPVVLWTVFRLGPGGAAASMLTVVAVGLWHTGRTAGPFALFDMPLALVILRAQGSAILTSLSLVLLAGLVAERRRLFEEIRTLRGLIPICAWCHKVRDDAGFWHGIETYLGSHTEATFSHSICPACSQEQEHDLTTHRAAGQSGRRAPAREES